MSDIFISYSRKDSAFVQQLYTALAAHDQNIWVDWEGIPLSANWWREICDGIEAADTFVFIMSPDSVASPVCNFEVFHAATYNKRIVPIVYRQVDETAAFAKLAGEKLNEGAREILGQRDMMSIVRESWSALARHNWLFFGESEVDFDQKVENLLDILNTDLDHIRTHTRLLLRALQWQQSNREASRLLRGTEIVEAEAWQQAAVDNDPVPATLHVAYILASRQRQRNQNRIVLVLAALVVMMAISLALVANSQRVLATQNAATAVANASTAVYERNRADEAARVAEASFAALRGGNEMERGNLDLGLLISVHALGIADTSPARSTLLTAIQQLPQLEQVVISQAAALRTVAYSPSFQSAVFATGDVQGAIQLWDGADGTPLGMPLRQAGQVNTLAFTADGDVLVSGGIDGIHRWEVASGAEIGSVFGQYPDEEVYDLSLSSDDQYVVVGYENRRGTTKSKARIFRLADGELITEITGQSTAIYAVDFSPDDRLVATGGSDNQITVWSFTEDADINEIVQLVGHGNWIWDLEFHPENRWLFSASADGTLRVWDTATGALLNTFQGHSGWVRDIAISSLGSMATGSGDTSILPRDAAGQHDLTLPQLRGHVDEVWEVAFNPDGSKLVSVSEDGQILVWSMVPVSSLNTPLGNLPATYLDVIYSHDGQSIYAAVGPNVQVWDSASQRIVREPVAVDNDITTLDDAPDLLAIGTIRGGVSLVNTVTGATLWQSDLHRGVVRSVQFSPDASLVASADDRGQIRLWEAATGRPVGDPLEGHGDQPVRSIAWHPDGDVLVSASDDRRLLLWDAAAGALRSELAIVHTAPILSVTFNHSGTILASAGRDHQIYLWDMTAAAESPLPLQRHTTAVNDLAFSPDDRHLVSASDDGTLILWDATVGVPIGLPFTGHRLAVTGVAYAPDGATFVSGGHDDMVRIWQANVPAWRATACRIANRDLTLQEWERFISLDVYTPGCE